MHRVGFFKSSVLVDGVNYAGLPLLVVYFVSMFIYPWFAGNASWEYVQLVWDRWQSLNTGALAFIASLLAFNISRFNENRQRERDFVAARAFLPSTLSGLMQYCSQCASIYDTLWDRPRESPQSIEMPELPSDYREVFANCIRHARPDIGAYLSNILVRLQVHEARLRDAVDHANGGVDRSVDRSTLITYVMRLGELYALAGNLFGFARDEEAFEAKPLTWVNMKSAYRLLNLEIEDMFITEQINLEAFTRRWLERTNAQSSTTTT